MLPSRELRSTLAEPALAEQPIASGRNNGSGRRLERTAAKQRP